MDEQKQLLKPRDMQDGIYNFHITGGQARKDGSKLALFLHLAIDVELEIDGKREITDIKLSIPYPIVLELDSSKIIKPEKTILT